MRGADISKATARTLHLLHYRGLLRVAGRENGIRLYERAGPAHEPLEPAERMRRLVLRIAGNLHKILDRSLKCGGFFLLRHWGPSLPGRKSIASNLLKTGDLQSAIF